MAFSPIRFLVRRRASRLMSWAATLLLVSCASYSPAPLPERADLASEASSLSVSASDMPLPALSSHPFDPTRPLDMDEVAMVAVANNPDLKALRRKTGVARAQAFAAGLLPNPQLTFDYGFLTGGPGTTDALTLGLAQDIVPLLARSARQRAATASQQSAELDLLWQEWQVVSQARLLFVAAVELRRQHAVLEENLALFAERYQRSSEAMQRGDETLPTVVSDLTGLKAIETQLHDADQLILKNRHDLNALLGLKPEAELRLADDLVSAPIDADRIAKALSNLAQRRPDLLALRAGYQAQEERLRQAVVQQFPSLNIGVIRGKDTTGVQTTTLGVTIGLPIFDRNQGNIAIERATRQQLRDEYQARLDSAYSAADRLVSEQRLLDTQYRSTQDSIVQLRASATIADRAYGAGNLDERSWVDLQAALLEKRLEALKLEQTLLEQRVNLQTLIGTDLPLLPLSQESS
jgi:outer membrane protein TolC